MAIQHKDRCLRLKMPLPKKQTVALHDGRKLISRWNLVGGPSNMNTTSNFQAPPLEFLDLGEVIITSIAPVVSCLGLLLLSFSLFF